MYYDEEQKVLKTVYEDLSCSDGPVYYLMELNGENGSILSQQKLSDSNHVLLNYFFTEDGELDPFRSSPMYEPGASETNCVPLYSYITTAQMP